MSWVAESALIVEVPEAEPLVGAWRRAHDPVAARGIPAHVTALYQFVAPALIDDATRARVAAVVGAQRAFGCQLTRVDRFEGVAVWLAPEPDGPFRSLTESLVRAFPDCVPYRGTVGRPTPHLTVAQADPDDPSGFAELERAVRADLEPRLPVPVAVRAVSLFVSDDHGRWTRQARFDLGP